jgi:hypothetical protein
MDAQNLARGQGVTIDDLGPLKDKSYLTSASLLGVCEDPCVEERIDHRSGFIGRGVMLLQGAGEWGVRGSSIRIWTI